MTTAAVSINKVLKRKKRDTESSRGYDTPSPAVWASIQSTYSKVRLAQAWVLDKKQADKHDSGQYGHGSTAYLTLRQELLQMPPNLLRRCFSNHKLDVTDLMR